MLLRATLATLEHEVCPVCGLDVNLRGQTTGQPSPTGRRRRSGHSQKTKNTRE